MYNLRFRKLFILLWQLQCKIHKLTLADVPQNMLKTSALESFLNEGAGPACKIIKKKLQYMCLPVNFAKFLGTLFLKNTSKKRCSYKFRKIQIQISPEACNFIKKETLALVFACEFCEISKNAFFTEHLWWLLLIFAESVSCTWRH